MINAEQIRAARALLDWSTADLAKQTNLTVNGINKIERGHVQAHRDTIETLQDVFESAGIEFLDDSGLRHKNNKVREIEGPECYARLLDEVYYQLGKGDEFLVAWADETLSPPAVHEAMKRIVKKGITYRKFVQQGNTYICGPLPWYHYIPTPYYQNATAVFFGDKSAYLTEDFKKVIILTDSAMTKANKNFFEIIWSSTRGPTETIANEKYE